MRSFCTCSDFYITKGQEHSCQGSSSFSFCFQSFSTWSYLSRLQLQSKFHINSKQKQELLILPDRVIPKASTWFRLENSRALPSAWDWVHSLITSQFYPEVRHKHVQTPFFSQYFVQKVNMSTHSRQKLYLVPNNVNFTW